MPVEKGTRLGPYEIVQAIGAGGMGEVFRAVDTRLDRTVAVKVLPTHLALSPQLRERFDREARALSSLSHPNICTLYDVGHQDGVDYIVMELLDGEALDDRLRKGPLPLEQVLRYGAQIAEGLERAHRSGIVHRDLKPGNIMLTKSGAKILDFGLAKSAARAIAANAETEQFKPLTAEGTIVGTFQYMAPEQLEGDVADSRTDIFAFGTILYEMATGRRAFDGKTRTSIMAAILSSEPPPLSQVQPTTPAALDRVIRRCLAKDPEERWQSAQDLAAELRWIASSDSAAIAPVSLSRPRTRRNTALALVAAAGIVTSLVFGTLFVRERQLRQPTLLTSAIKTPDGLEFSADGGMAFSPDGSMLAFANDSAEESARKVYIRNMATGAVTALAGTEGAEVPFWSPDGRNIAFFAGGKLKRIALDGGTAQTICDAESPRGGTWSAENLIVFAPAFRDGLFSVAASGGVPKRLTTLSPKEISHRWPAFLPDGRHVLFLSQQAEGGAPNDPSTIDVYSLDDRSRVSLVRANSSPSYADGHVFFWREGSLLAHEFDPSTVRLSGEPFVVASGVGYSGNELVSVSVARGSLAYLPNVMRTTRLVWVDRAGRELEVLAENGRFSGPVLSPDGKHVALSQQQGSADLWVIDTEKKMRSRVTADAGDEYAPVWSPDGSRIAYASNEPPVGIWTVPATGGRAERLWQGENPAVRGWARDGRVLIEYLDSKLKWGIGLYSTKDRTFTPVVQTAFLEVGPVFSPDQESIAFMSDRTGRLEVYVQSLTSGQQWQISTDGGVFPRWSRDGGEIYYLTTDGRIVSVAVRRSPTFTAAPPETLFAVELFASQEAQYDVLDRNHFLVNKPAANSRIDTVTFIKNWTLLKKN